MEPIIDPISVDILKSELTPARKLRDTNKGGNEIYIVNHHDSPNVMKERSSSIAKPFWIYS